MGVKQNRLTDVPYKANLLLQILLVLNVYISTAWTLSYGFYVVYDISNLKSFQGALLVVGYIIAIIVESCRLFAGYSGNLRAKTGDLSIFLIITPLIQLPILVFLFLSVQTQVKLITILTSIVFALMFLEFIVGCFTWRMYCYDQIELYKLRRQSTVQNHKFPLIH